jgi:hypothetical protein
MSGSGSEVGEKSKGWDSLQDLEVEDNLDLTNGEQHPFVDWPAFREKTT